MRENSDRIFLPDTPDVTFESKTITTRESLTLSCTASGVPSTYNFGEFIQYWGDTEVDSLTGTQSADIYSYTNNSPTYLDVGDYVCSVDNTLRDSTGGVIVKTKKVRVVVQGKVRHFYLSTTREKLTSGCSCCSR
jgi:hypothetical protein